MGMEPTAWDHVFWAFWGPHTILSWLCIAMAMWQLFVSRRHDLALHFLVMAWYVALAVELLLFKRLLDSLTGPWTACFYAPRDTIVATARTKLILAALTIPLAMVARRSRQAVLPAHLGVLLLSLFQVTGIIHVSLWLLFSPLGRWPSLADYFAMLKG